MVQVKSQFYSKFVISNFLLLIIGATAQLIYMCTRVYKQAQANSNAMFYCPLIYSNIEFTMSRLNNYTDYDEDK